MKKNSITNIINLVLVTLLTGLFLYLFWSAWRIFGLLMLLWAGLAILFGNVLIGMFVKAKDKKIENGVIIYNPQEWKSMLMLIIPYLAATALLFYLNNRSVLTPAEYITGFAFVCSIFILPSFYYIYAVIRDRNDFIQIAPQSIVYQDNSNKVTIHPANIKKAEVFRSDVRLTIINGTYHTIPLSDMGFGSSLMEQVVKDIQVIIPEVNRERLPDTNGEAAKVQPGETPKYFTPDQNTTSDQPGVVVEKAVGWSHVGYALIYIPALLCLIWFIISVTQYFGEKADNILFDHDFSRQIIQDSHQYERVGNKIWIWFFALWGVFMLAVLIVKATASSLRKRSGKAA